MYIVNNRQAGRNILNWAQGLGFCAERLDDKLMILDPKECLVGIVDFSGRMGPYPVIEIDADINKPSVMSFTAIVEQYCIKK